MIGLLAHLHVEHREAGGDVGAANRLAVPGDAHREGVRDGGPVRGDVELQPVAVPRDHVRHRPGPDVRAGLADRRERLGRGRETREHRGREDRSGDEQDLAADEPAQEPGGRLAELGPGLRRHQPGLRAEQVDRGEQHRRQEQPDLDEQGLAVRGLPERSERRQVEQSRPRSPSRSASSPRRRRRSRSGGRRRPARPPVGPTAARPRGRAGRRGRRSRSSRRADGASRRAATSPAGSSGQRGPRGPGHEERRACGGTRRRARAARRPSAGAGRAGRARREPGGGGEERDAELEVEDPAAERGHAHQRYERTDGRRPSAGRTSRSRCRRRPAWRRVRCRAATKNAIDSAPQPRSAHARDQRPGDQHPQREQPDRRPSPRGRPPSGRSGAEAWPRSPRSKGSRTAAPGRGSGRPRT